MNRSKEKTIMTVGFIFILIFVRIICYATDQILYIVYAINIVGLFYVLSQIAVEINGILMSSVDNEMNIVIIKRNSRVKKNFKWIALLLSGFLIGIGLVVYFKALNTVLAIINDVISLITLGISIEDETLRDEICSHIKKIG